MDVSRRDIDKLTKVLRGIRCELMRIADHLNPIGTDMSDKGREVKYEELVRYVDGLRVEGSCHASGLESRIWRALLETLLGVRGGLVKDQATPIPLTRLREGVELGSGRFTNMGDISWQIYTGFVKSIS